MYDDSTLVARLVDVLTVAAEWMTKLDAYAKFSTEDGQGFLRRQDKAAAEAILLAYLASRVSRGDPKLAEAVATLCARAEVHIATDRNEALLRRFPQTATTLGVGFVLLAQLGRDHPRVEARLRSALDRRFATLSERSTFRMMDTRWTFGLLDPRLVPPVEELVPLSTLAARPHPIYTMTDDDYALTHAVYYLTDFGRRPPSADLRAGTTDLLEPFLAWHAVRLDLDLLGEFLIASLALRDAATAAFGYASHLFFRAWEDGGGLVGPEYSPARYAALHGEEAAAYAFSENYHTVFVGGILCAVALETPPTGRPAAEPRPAIDPGFALRCPYAARAARSRSVGTAGASTHQPSLPSAENLPEWMAARLLALQPPGNSTPPWLRAAMECNLSRAEIAATLYDALLVGCAKEYHLVQLTEALAVGAEFPALRTATFVRALDFLLDQQLEDGFVGIHHLLTDRQDETVLAQAQRVIADLLERIAAALGR